MTDLFPMIDDFLEERAGFLRAVRRFLHAHPEPSRHEFATTQELARHLREAGVPHRLIPSARGLIAGPETPDPTIALRADLDALMIPDAKSVPYRSQNAGVMHACGHDAHAAIVLGAALSLHDLNRRLDPPLPWRALFQPAEEVGEGAFEMIEAGAMDHTRAILALHVDPERDVGRVGYRVGPMTADCQELHILIRGVGGHAARPYQTVDPIAAAVQFISQVYQAVPRVVDTRDPVVVTFGSVRGGELPNVIPDQVTLLGTIRTFTPSAKQRVHSALSAIARGVAGATGAEFEVSFLQGSTAVVNDPEVTAVMVHAAAGVVGPDHVDLLPQPSLGGEDFSGYLAHAPGCLLRLGVAAGPGWPVLHSPRFDLDERALVLGANILTRSVLLLAQRGTGDDHPHLDSALRA